MKSWKLIFRLNLKLKNEFSFPIHHKAFKTSDVTSHIPTVLHKNIDIENSVQLALARAVTRAHNFSLIKNPNKATVPRPDLRVILSTEVNVIDDFFIEEDGDKNYINDADDHQEMNGDCDNIQEMENELDQEEDLNDVIEDLFIVSSKLFTTQILMSVVHLLEYRKVKATLLLLKSKVYYG